VGVINANNLQTTFQSLLLNAEHFLRIDAVAIYLTNWCYVEVCKALTPSPSPVGEGTRK
jgi:hypothetical protein